MTGTKRTRTPLQAAEDKGRQAWARGEPESACPYQDTRKGDGRLTWARAFRNAWVQGYRAAKGAG